MISKYLGTLQQLVSDLEAQWGPSGRIADATLRPDEL